MFVWCLPETGVYKLQTCKLMSNTITGFDVEHKRFTLASSIYSHNTKFPQKINFLIERPRTRLGLNCFKYLGPKFLSNVPDKQQQQ